MSGQAVKPSRGELGRDHRARMIHIHDDFCGTVVRSIAGKEHRVPRLRGDWPHLKDGQPREFAPHPLGLLFRIGRGVSRLRTEVPIAARCPLPFLSQAAGAMGQPRSLSAVTSRTFVHHAGWRDYYGICGTRTTRTYPVPRDVYSTKETPS